MQCYIYTIYKIVNLLLRIFALHLSQFGKVVVEKNLVEMVFIMQCPTSNFNFIC